MIQIKKLFIYLPMITYWILYLFRFWTSQKCFNITNGFHWWKTCSWNQSYLRRKQKYWHCNEVRKYISKKLEMILFFNIIFIIVIWPRILLEIMLSIIQSKLSVSSSSFWFFFFYIKYFFSLNFRSYA